MHALLSTVLPPSAVHHSLFLPNFTPSTIYPLPQPHNEEQEIKVVGNLIVAGSEDIRVFEIRESIIAISDQPAGAKSVTDTGFESKPADVEGMEEDFYDTGHAEVRLLPMHFLRSCAHFSVLRFDMSRVESYIF